MMKHCEFLVLNREMTRIEYEKKWEIVQLLSFPRVYPEGFLFLNFNTVSFGYYVLFSTLFREDLLLSVLLMSTDTSVLTDAKIFVDT